MSETGLNLDQNSGGVNPRDLILPLWQFRKKILTIALIFSFLGGIIGFLTPKTYTTSSTFLPQTSQSSGGLSGSLGGLASLAGISLNASMDGGDIPPNMYGMVLASEPFRKRILDSKIWVKDDSITYRTYLENQPISVLGTIQEYIIGLPGKLIGLFVDQTEEDQIIIEKTGLQPLSNKEYDLLETVSEKVNIVNDQKIGVIKIVVVESDPIIAAQVTEVTEKVLQDWISEHKMKNAKVQYDFILKQFDAKQKEFYSIQNQLAGYMDRNQNVLSATYLTQLERLQAEFNLVNSVYSELANQKEQAAIQLSKDTPTFSVLDPVKVPKEKTGPKMAIYFLGAFFMGLILSTGWFLVGNPVYKFFRSLQS